MVKIETQAQYEWTVKRVEELLPLVTDETCIGSISGECWAGFP